MVTRWPVSSSTSRRAAVIASSPAASFPLGSPHPPSLRNWTTANCGVRSLRSTIPPAARIGTRDLSLRSFIRTQSTCREPFAGTSRFVTHIDCCTPVPPAQTSRLPSECDAQVTLDELLETEPQLLCLNVATRNSRTAFTVAWYAP